MNENERRVLIEELSEKVTVLEIAIKYMERDMEELARLLKEHMEKEEKERKELMEKLTEMNLKITQYKGTIGGITLTVSAIFTVIIAVGGLLLNYFLKK